MKMLLSNTGILKGRGVNVYHSENTPYFSAGKDD